MFLRSLAIAIAPIIFAAAVTASHAQNATVSGSASASAPPATIDASGSTKTNQGTIGAGSRAEGRIEKADRRKGQIDFDLIGFAAGMKLAAMLTKRAGAARLAFWGNKESEDE